MKKYEYELVHTFSCVESMLGNNNSNGSSTLHPSAQNHSVTAVPADIASYTITNSDNINNTNINITQNNDARKKSAGEVSQLTEQHFYPSMAIDNSSDIIVV